MILRNRSVFLYLIKMPLPLMKEFNFFYKNKTPQDYKKIFFYFTFISCIKMKH